MSARDPPPRDRGRASIGLVIRLAKVMAALSVGLLGAGVVFNNLTDYRTNFEFISHVLRMDEVTNKRIRYRAVRSVPLHHAAHILIICQEASIALLCTAGAAEMLKNLGADAATFHASKRWVIAGMADALALWFFVFQVIGGEWFGMWMAKKWNGIPDATRLTLYVSGMLIFVSLKNDD